MFSKRKTHLALLFLCLAVAPRQAQGEARACISHNNDGADARVAHHLLAAREAYRSCVAEPDCPDMVLSECNEALEDLKTTIPTLIVSVVDENHRDVDAPSLAIDDQPVKLDGSTIELDPGAHELIATSGALTNRLRVQANEHELNRNVEIMLSAPPAFAAPLSSVPPGAAAVSPHSYLPVYILGGVGAAAAASFGYFSLAGHSEMNDLRTCKPGCDPVYVHRVQTKYHLADASLGVSVVALASAGYFLWRNKTEVRAQTGVMTFDFSAWSTLAMVNLTLRQ